MAVGDKRRERVSPCAPSPIHIKYAYKNGSLPVLSSLYSKIPHPHPRLLIHSLLPSSHLPPIQQITSTATSTYSLSHTHTQYVSPHNNTRLAHTLHRPPVCLHRLARLRLQDSPLGPALLPPAKHLCKDPQLRPKTRQRRPSRPRRHRSSPFGSNTQRNRHHHPCANYRVRKDHSGPGPINTFRPIASHYSIDKHEINKAS